MIERERSNMKPEELAAIVDNHQKYLLSKNTGKRADLREANLRGADLRGADLRGDNLSGANLRGADLSGANLSWANLRGANLRGANLRGANLSEADLSEANLSWANLSEARGLLDPIDWLTKNFEPVADGIIVYKAFGVQFTSPTHWEIATGAVLTEVVNPNRTDDCGSGINVATLEWCVRETKTAPKWRCLIRWPWLAGIVVPYNTDGKFRAGRIELVEMVSTPTIKADIA